MGCATESFCWFKPQQVNIFSARGGATWAEPICVERSCGQPLSARDSSDEKLRGSVGHGDAWESAAEGTRRSAAGLADDGGRSSMRRHPGGLIRLPPSPVAPRAGRCALQRKRASPTSGKRIHAPRPLCISMCFPQHKACRLRYLVRSHTCELAWVRLDGYCALFCGRGVGAQLCNETVGNYQVDFIDTQSDKYG